MKSGLLIISFILFTTLLLAQEKAPVFSFEQTTHDFGAIEEEQGPVAFVFNFVNKGNAPLVIQGVQPSCGCTTPDWTKEPVLPGKSGFIRAEFNPKNRPGAFNKSLTITSNTNPPVTRIYIQGSVNAKPRSVADDFPVVMGGLRVKYRSFNFQKITTEKPVIQSFEVYNETDSTISFTNKIDAPEHIAVTYSLQSISPKGTGRIIVTYDPAKKKDLGYVTDDITLYTNETANPEKQFRVVATIEEYFPPMTAENLAKAPKLTFDKLNFDFGNIKQNVKVTTDFNLTNTGKSALNIRQSKSNCGCTVVQIDKMTLEPGESIPVKVTFDPTGRRGVQQKSISLFSNDPMNPTQMITIKANVEMEGGAK
jgi:hypothetical protein